MPEMKVTVWNCSEHGETEVPMELTKAFCTICGKEMKKIGEYETEEGIPKEKIKELKRQNAQELAKEIVAFIKEEFPEDLESSSLRSELFELFWSKKGVSNKYDIEDSELNYKIKKAEILAEKILKGEIVSSEIPPSIIEELRKKSVDEIAQDILNFVKEKIDNYPDFLFSLQLLSSYQVMRDYFVDKGLPYDIFLNYHIPKFHRAPEINLKVDKVLNLLENKLRDEVARIKTEKYQQLLQSLLPKVLNWAKEKRIGKITKTDIDVFLMETKVIVPIGFGGRETFRDMLYRLVKSKAF